MLDRIIEMPLNTYVVRRLKHRYLSSSSMQYLPRGGREGQLIYILTPDKTIVATDNKVVINPESHPRLYNWNAACIYHIVNINDKADLTKGIIMYIHQPGLVLNEGPAITCSWVEGDVEYAGLAKCVAAMSEIVDDILEGSNVCNIYDRCHSSHENSGWRISPVSVSYPEQRPAIV